MISHLYSRVRDMIFKRKIIIALNEYEVIPDKTTSYASNKRQKGITQGEFIQFFLKRESGYSYEDIDRYINDCIQDGFINTKLVNNTENISVSSKGRELKSKTFFILKYIPDTFSRPTDIIVQVIITVVTSYIVVRWLQ